MSHKATVRCDLFEVPDNILHTPHLKCNKLNQQSNKLTHEYSFSSENIQGYLQVLRKWAFEHAHACYWLSDEVINTMLKRCIIIKTTPFKISKLSRSELS